MFAVCAFFDLDLQTTVMSPRNCYGLQ